MSEAEEETKRKLSDPTWRMANLYWIEDFNGKKVKFKPNWEQMTMYNAWHALSIVLKPRQIGISTFVSLMMLDFTLFCPNKTAGIIDKTDDDAKKKLAKIKFAYDHLDDPDDPATAGMGAWIKTWNPLVVDNTKALEWKRGSKIWSGTNMRGGTLQFLWITELGHTSFYNPEAAQEIKKGALNTIHVGNTVVIESTHEGGKFGVFYSMVKLAMETKEPLGDMDWKFFFFPWWRSVQYSLPLRSPLVLTKDDQDYFAQLASRGIHLTDEQKNWYVKKKATIGDAIMKEYPSVEEECFEAIVSGAIYGKTMSQLRAAKRIIDFDHDRTAPLFTFWDIGFSDFCALWLLQFVGREIHALAYRCNCREMPPYYVAIVREWERTYGVAVKTNFLPHDADKKEMSGKSMRDYLRDAGMPNTVAVTVIRDSWIGINRLRALLPKFYFHKTNCGVEWQHEGRVMPSGISCLEGYHTMEDASSGVIRETPIHDDNSHGADALRCMAESEMRGLIDTTSTALDDSPQRKPKVLLAGWDGPRPEPYSSTSHRWNVRRM